MLTWLGRLTPYVASPQSGKTLNINELAFFHALAGRASASMQAVKQLLTEIRIDSAASRRLTQSEKRFYRAYARMIAKLQGIQVDHSQTYGVLMCLNRAGLPGDLGQKVISFVA